MSNCTIRVLLDGDKDQTFRGKDTVSGEVHVDVHKDTECRAFYVKRYWETHGRGNHDRGPVEQRKLFSGIWKAGSSHRFPFEFEMPAFPITYHGHYLNIDHYVEGTADVPRSRDPRGRQEVLLAPGGAGRDEAPLGALPAADARRRAAGCGSTFGVIVAGVLLLGGFLFPFTIPGVLFMIVGIVILVFALRGKIARARLGEVSCVVEPASLVPGQDVRVRLGFHPKSAVRINGVFVSLVGRESCVSGSGTNKTTHRHVLLKERGELIGPRVIPKGAFSAEGEVAIPATAADSFRGDNNDLKWELKVTVGIPVWPDWEETIPLRIRSSGAPTDSAASVSGPPPLPVAPEVPVTSPPPPLPPMPRLDPVPEAAVERPIEPIPVPELDVDLAAPVLSGPPEDSARNPAEQLPQATGDLAQEIEAIHELDRFGSDRKAKIASLEGRSFRVSLAIKRIDWTFGIVGPAYRSGRTANGTIDGTTANLSVRFPADRNDEIEALEVGATIGVDATVCGWSVLHDTPELEAK